MSLDVRPKTQLSIYPRQFPGLGWWLIVSGECREPIAIGNPKQGCCTWGIRWGITEEGRGVCCHLEQGEDSHSWRCYRSNIVLVQGSIDCHRKQWLSFAFLEVPVRWWVPGRSIDFSVSINWAHHSQLEKQEMAVSFSFRRVAFVYSTGPWLRDKFRISMVETDKTFVLLLSNRTCKWRAQQTSTDKPAKEVSDASKDCFTPPLHPRHQKPSAKTTEI